MNWLLLLHVLVMFFAFAFTAGSGMFMAAAVQTENPDVARTATSINRRFGMTGGILLLIGLILGGALAGQMGLSMSATWLVVSYVCIALILILGFGVLMPFAARISKAAEASGAQASPELKAALHNPAGRIAGPITGLLWIIVIAMMVLRPQ